MMTNKKIEKELIKLLNKFVNKELLNEEMTISQENDYFNILNDLEEFIKNLNNNEVFKNDK